MERVRLNYKGNFKNPDKIIIPREFSKSYADKMYSKIEKEYTTKEDPFGELKLGDRIQFIAGYNDDILYESLVLGFCKEETESYFKKGMVYVYIDSYWFPIKRDTIIKVD